MKPVLWALIMLLAACSGGAGSQDDSPDLGELADPEDVVAAVIEALNEDDPRRAADLSDAAQVPLLAIAEGLGARGLSQLTTADLDLVATNFWSGFAAQLRSSLGASDLVIGDMTIIEVGDSRFAVVDLERPADASVRRLVLRETVDGWVVDLVASFPFPLLARVPEAADISRSVGDAAFRRTLVEMEDSILLVLDDPDVAPQVHQAALAALESIGR
jgi:hypothetical protein